MEQPTEDAAMDPQTSSKVSPAYALAAAAIWALVLYSVLSHPQSQRLAMQTLQTCVAR